MNFTESVKYFNTFDIYSLSTDSLEYQLLINFSRESSLEPDLLKIAECVDALIKMNPMQFDSVVLGGLYESLLFFQFLDCKPKGHKKTALAKANFRSLCLLCAVVRWVDYMQAVSSNDLDAKCRIIADCSFYLGSSGIHSAQSKGGKNRHVGSGPLRKWLYTRVISMDKQTPFLSRKEAANFVILDLIAEAKRQGLSKSAFNPENAYEWAYAELSQRGFLPQAS